MADSAFFLRVRGKVSGPFDLPGLQKLVRRGMLSRIHEISSDKVTWNTAGEFEDLFPTTPPPPTPQLEASDAESTATQLAVPMPDPSGQSIEVSPASPEYEVETTKDCPFCGAEIQTFATKCRHCGEWLDGRSRAAALNYVPNVQPYFPVAPQQSGYQTAAGSYRGMATAAMILSICGVFCFGFITGLLAVIFAGIALAGMGRTGNNEGKGMAITGLVVGILDILGWLIWLGMVMS